MNTPGRSGAGRLHNSLVHIVCPWSADGRVRRHLLLCVAVDTEW